MKNGLIIGTIACMVAVILVGSVLAPIINTTTTTTIKVDNDGAVGLRMEKITTGNFTITFDEVDGEFTATNGSDAQVIDDVCIFYADNNVAVWLDDSSVRMVGVDADDKIFNAALSDSEAITITKSSEGVNITDGTVDKTFPVPSWSFVPKSTGAYGFFLNETEVNTAGMDTLFVGSFAGVDCYNGIIANDLPIVLDKTASGSTLSGAKWIKAAAEPEELNPDDLQIIPLEPSINPIDPEPEDAPMAVPTPTYTDGEWGYDLITSGANSGGAKIVSYSGTGGDIVVPSTVGGYTVKEFGKKGGSYMVFDNTVLSPNSTLTLPDGLTIINSGCCYQCSNIIEINIPDTVTSIGYNSLRSTGVMKTTGATGNTVIIPSNVTELGSNGQQYGAFTQCTKIEYFYTLGNLTIIGQEFDGCTNLKGIVFMDDVVVNRTSSVFSSSCMQYLNFGNYEITAGVNGVNSGAEIRQGEDANIPALGYLAVAQFNETVRDEGPMAAMFAVIPLIMVIAILMFAVGFAIYRRME